MLCTAWAPNGKSLASACKSGEIRVWEAESGKQTGRSLAGHKKWVTCLAWQPLHLDPHCRKLASSSKDGDVRIWDTLLGSCLICLSGHQQGVSCIRWGGTGLIYSASQVRHAWLSLSDRIWVPSLTSSSFQDRTVKVWRSEDGALCRTLQGHAHWVNTLALSTDYVLRTGAFEPSEFGAPPPTRGPPPTPDEAQRKAQQRYDALRLVGAERLVSGSDDFTLFLWHPETEKKHTGNFLPGLFLSLFLLHLVVPPQNAER